MPKLVVLKNRFQVLEMRENANMLVEDWNTQVNVCASLIQSHSKLIVLFIVLTGKSIDGLTQCGNSLNSS